MLNSIQHRAHPMRSDIAAPSLALPEGPGPAIPRHLRSFRSPTRGHGKCPGKITIAVGSAPDGSLPKNEPTWMAAFAAMTVTVMVALQPLSRDRARSRRLPFRHGHAGAIHDKRDARILQTRRSDTAQRRSADVMIKLPLRASTAECSRTRAGHRCRRAATHRGVRDGASCRARGPSR